MKRVILTITGTVLGLVALLSFKSHSTITTATTALPSAALPGSSSSSSPSSPSTTTAPTTTTSAPPNPSTSAPSTTSKSYTGQAVTTRYGIVQVKITVQGSKITNVSFAQLTAFDGRSQRINSDAAPTLLQETLSAQSANIDSVSGASYTSQGYEQSLQSALDQAGIK
jgi:uncharacterized protein with FMN-binding domain